MRQAIGEPRPEGIVGVVIETPVLCFHQLTQSGLERLVDQRTLTGRQPSVDGPRPVAPVGGSQEPLLVGGVPLGPQGLAVVAGEAGELGPREPQRVLEQASLDLGLGYRNQDPDLLERQPALLRTPF